MKIINHLALLIMIIGLTGLVTQCNNAQPVVAPPTASPTERPTETVVIGFTTSETGPQEVPSTGQRRGLDLWLDHTRQGITLPDGRLIRFEFVSYNDHGDRDLVQQLYSRLINEANVDFLISPYSSDLTDAAAFVAEEYGKLMITTGAASDETYKKGFQSIYQLYTPASRYLTGAVDFLNHQDPTAKRIAFVYENTKFSTDVVNAAKDYAESLGYQVVLIEGYEPTTTEFAFFINKIVTAEPEIIMGGGHFNDGTALARQIYDHLLPLKALVLLVAPPDLKFAELEEAAVGVIGPSQWEPKAHYMPQSAVTTKLEWYGLTGDEFVAQYEAEYGEEPSYHAAGGYAAGLVLQKAIETAGSTEPAQVKLALDNLKLLTFYGAIQFNNTPQQHGLQEAHSMVYIQWQRNDAGELVKEVIWPLEAKSAGPIYPLRLVNP